MFTCGTDAGVIDAKGSVLNDAATPIFEELGCNVFGL